MVNKSEQTIPPTDLVNQVQIFFKSEWIGSKSSQVQPTQQQVAEPFGHFTQAHKAQ